METNNHLLTENLLNFIHKEGAVDASIFYQEENSYLKEAFPKEKQIKLNSIISIVVKLSDSIINEIETEPTISYFHHYRTVNYFIDQLLLKTSFLLEQYGYNYLPIPASQSDPFNNVLYSGRYSHKKAACLSGLGFIGRNGLFIHKKYGPRVRLGTIFTDYIPDSQYKNNSEQKTTNNFLHPYCKNCSICEKRCPASAIKNSKTFSQILETNTTNKILTREDIFDPEKCSTYMKNNFKHIGRGAVCGICIKVCPLGQNKDLQ